MNFCPQCNAYLPYDSLARHEMKIFHKVLTSERKLSGWMDLFHETTSPGFLSCLRTYLYCPGLVESYQWSVSSTSCDYICCADYGRNSAHACYMRCHLIYIATSGFLKESFSGPDWDEEIYYGIVEMILVFLQGELPGVIRPVQSLLWLRQYTGVARQKIWDHSLRRYSLL